MRHVVRSKALQRGQTLVEFAILLPLVVLLVAAIIDFGFLFYDHVATQSAAREAARAMICASSSGTPIFGETELRNIAKRAHGPVNQLLDTEITVTTTEGSHEFDTSVDSSPKTVRELRINHVHRWLLPIMIPFGETIMIRASVRAFCVNGLTRL